MAQARPSAALSRCASQLGSQRSLAKIMPTTSAGSATLVSTSRPSAQFELPMLRVTLHSISAARITPGTTAGSSQRRYQGTYGFVAGVVATMTRLSSRIRLLPIGGVGVEKPPPFFEGIVSLQTTRLHISVFQSKYLTGILPHRARQFLQRDLAQRRHPFSY